MSTLCDNLAKFQMSLMSDKTDDPEKQKDITKQLTSINTLMSSAMRFRNVFRKIQKLKILYEDMLYTTQMPHYNPKFIKGRNLKEIRGGGSFLLGNTLGGLQSVNEEESAYNGKGMSSINAKLEKLIVKSKPKNIKFSM